MARKETVISTRIFVGNLNFRTTKEDLTELLAEAGQVVDVRLPTDRETGKPRGFAFVEFSSATEAAEAIKKFHDREVAGRRLNVNAADDRPRPAGRPRPFSPASPRDYADASGLTSNSNAFTNQGNEAFRPFKAKGSRRGMRGRKRSLNY